MIGGGLNGAFQIQVKSESAVGIDKDKSVLTAASELRRQADVEGHGIGLATVERIVRHHGGRIWATSEPGKRATFMFTLE